MASRTKECRHLALLRPPAPRQRSPMEGVSHGTMAGYVARLDSAQASGTQRLSRATLLLCLRLSCMFTGAAVKKIVLLFQVCPLHDDTYTNPEKYKITYHDPLKSFAVMLAFLNEVGITKEQVLVIEVQLEPSDWSEMYPWAIEQSRRVNKVLLQIALERGAIAIDCPMMGCGTTWAGEEIDALWTAAGLQGRSGTCYHPSPQWIKWLWRAVSALWTLRYLMQSEPSLVELVDGARRAFFLGGSSGALANTMTLELVQKNVKQLQALCLTLSFEL